MSYTDIKSLKILEALPAKIRPYAYLARLDRPIGWWLLLLPCWWSVSLATGGVYNFGLTEIWILFLFFIGAIIMRAAGCVINDLWDRKLDKEVERTRDRPLASGQISPFQALIFLTFLLICGLIILLQLESITAILLGFLALPLIALYPLMKRITWWPQAFLGITFNFGALIGWASINGIIELPCLLLYISGLFWTLGYDTIYAHQDMEDDVKIGIKSSALKLGDKSSRWVSIFYALCALFLFSAFFTADAGPVSYILLLPATFHLYTQVKSWKMGDQQNSLNTFKSNRNFGLLVFLAALL
jgi:4-hydroxybenzoate polyprenyltransferase